MTAEWSTAVASSPRAAEIAHHNPREELALRLLRCKGRCSEPLFPVAGVSPLRCSSLDQPCRALIANECALVREEAERGIESDRNVLVGKTGYYATAA
jgi:hypothetical protein